MPASRSCSPVETVETLEKRSNWFISRPLGMAFLGGEGDAWPILDVGAAARSKEQLLRQLLGHVAIHHRASAAAPAGVLEDEPDITVGIDQQLDAHARCVGHAA